MSSPGVETKRLYLRPVSVKDLAHFLILDSDQKVRAFFPSGALSPDQIKTMLTRFIANDTLYGIPAFSIFLRETDELIGRMGFSIMPTGDIEVGYILFEKYWGRGLASEGLEALLKWARTHLSVEYLIAYAVTENTKSFHVMEKCGMTYYKTDVAKGCDCRFYRIKNK